MAAGVLAQEASIMGKAPASLRELSKSSAGVSLTTTIGPSRAINTTPNERKTG
jgi:hypothetical protein